jgi:hypothetical protein
MESIRGTLIFVLTPLSAERQNSTDAREKKIIMEILRGAFSKTLSVSNMEMKDHS